MQASSLKPQASLGWIKFGIFASLCLPLHAVASDPAASLSPEQQRVNFLAVLDEQISAFSRSINDAIDCCGGVASRLKNMRLDQANLRNLEKLKSIVNGNPLIFSTHGEPPDGILHGSFQAYSEIEIYLTQIQSAPLSPEEQQLKRLEACERGERGERGKRDLVTIQEIVSRERLEAYEPGEREHAKTQESVSEKELKPPIRRSSSGTVVDLENLKTYLRTETPRGFISNLSAKYGVFNPIARLKIWVLNGNENEKLLKGVESALPGFLQILNAEERIQADEIIQQIKNVFTLPQ